jgi:PAS domain S-box-containing protein
MRREVVMEPDTLDSLRRRLAACEAELTALRTDAAELRAMFAAMQDLVLVMDRDGHYLKIAATAPDLLYRPSDELIGKSMHDVMPVAAADFFLRHIREALDRKHLVTMDYSMPIDDAEIWFSANISPMGADRVLLVCRDVTERKRLEQVMEDSLRQRALLDEISTPLIPISDQVVVMPLVGQLDRARMAQVLEALLTGIQTRRARTAILDITGVPEIEAEVAAGILQAARAVQLLGAQVVLTGIRPDVAQRLVTLGADFSGIVTRGTLQSGIAYAMGTTRSYA